jgi:hypothetical protein
MITRFYLIPFETDSGKMDGLVGKPKYVDLFPVGRATGLVSKETSLDRLNRTWLRNFYIVKFTTAEATNFAELDAQADVIHITKQKILNSVAKVQALGIDTTGLSASTTLQQMQRRVRFWLTEEDKDFAEI